MSPYTKYRQNQTLTADQGTLILMLYDGAITALKKAKQLLLAPSYSRAEFSDQIVKARNIVLELAGSLNFDAGEIAYNLWRLYDYMVWQIGQADIKKDPAILEDVLSHLTALRETWQQVFQGAKQEGQTITEPTDVKAPTSSQYFMVA